MTSTDTLRIAVVIAAHGAHERLTLLHRSLSVADRSPDQAVVVALDDDSIIGWAPERGVPVRVVPLSAVPEGLPVAAARNAGAGVALADGADVLLFLDVAAVAHTELVDAVAAAVARHPDALWSGTSTHLGAAPPGGYDLSALHDEAADTGAGDDDLLAPEDVDDAVVALSRGAWGRLSGFCEDYVGVGFEVLDLARSAQNAGLRLGRAHGARVWLQEHDPVDDPHRAADLARNADLHRERWGIRVPA